MNKILMEIKLNKAKIILKEIIIILKIKIKIKKVE
jgi:hypothetical protein